MKLLITSTVRHAALTEDSGWIYEVDTDAWRVVRMCPMPPPMYREFDNNQRGGLRGGKGLIVEEDRVWIANASHIYSFDRQWNCVARFSHPSCAMIHDIALHGDDLWATSTRNDLLVRFDRAGRVTGYFDFRRFPEISKDIGLPQLTAWNEEALLRGDTDFRDPRTHVLEETNRTHINSVCFLAGGDMIVSMGRITPERMKRLWHVKQWLKGRGLWPWVVKISQLMTRFTGMKSARHSNLVMVPGSYDTVLLRVSGDGACHIWKRWRNVMVPMHSLRTLPDGHVLYNNTDSGEVLKLDEATGEILQQVFVDSAFLRGNDAVSDEHLVVGSQNQLFEMNLRDGRTTRSLLLNEDARSSIFAVAALPDGMAPLPERLYVDAEQEGGS